MATFKHNETTDNAIEGTSVGGLGVIGRSTNNYGVRASSIESAGVRGSSEKGRGVEGWAKLSEGVVGISTSGNGVWGQTESAGIGVLGTSKFGPGVAGRSEHLAGVRGDSTDGRGIEGTSVNDYGVRGHSHKSAGIRGSSDEGRGIEGWAINSEGVVGLSKTGVGAWGQSEAGSGLLGTSKAGFGVQAASESGEALHAQTNSPGVAAIAAYNINPNGTGAALFARKAGALGHAGFFDGHVHVTGDLSVSNADCAEYFDIARGLMVEPGTVMVVGAGGALEESRRAYDKCVAGVISGAGCYNPGILLDKQAVNDQRQPLALLGKVFCKVDARQSPIEIGDLLTTSDLPGHAMKVLDSSQALGTLIGKALAPQSAGLGLIPILVALQ
ncbi:MAG: hypothetical protein ABI605_13660 [Rhizobacter sp.]